MCAILKRHELGLPLTIFGQVLSLQTNDIRYFLSLLKGINFASLASMTITTTGLIITVEEARSVTATAWIFKDVFDDYTYTPPRPEPPASARSSASLRLTPSQRTQSDATTVLEIPLHSLLDCLSVFTGHGAASSAKKRGVRPIDGDHDDLNDQAGRLDAYFGGGAKRTGMSMYYAGEGHPLTISIADTSGNGPSARCEISTFDPEGMLDIALDYEQTVLKIILKSSWLREALSELDPKEYDKLTFVGNPLGAQASGDARPSRSSSKPIFRIMASGSVGSTEMDYTNDREVLETFECEDSVSFSYRFSHIRGALAALQTSDKSSLRIDNEGILSLQFLMEQPNRTKQGAMQGYIDFLCLPMEEGF
ncbi:Rad1-domain-containing protein [Peniophora sp. CONT]|nr:Rad1-domain-containing protein [Peniophora sp. CONT]